MHQGHFTRIAKPLQRLHHDHSRALSVAALAEDAGFSAPTFHKRFKAVSSTSPLQYIKSVRLNQARLLMILDDLSTTLTTFTLGYENPSQFNRKFRRVFGRGQVK